MKKIILSAALLLSFSCAFAQTALPDLTKFPVATPKEATAANKNALQTAEYLLTNPIDKNHADRMDAARYLMEWMESSPDFTFSFDANFAAVCKEVDISALYIASMVNYQVSNNVKEATKAESVLIWETFAKYITNPANNVKQKDEVKKLAEAYKAGKLKEYLAR